MKKKIVVAVIAGVLSITAIGSVVVFANSGILNKNTTETIHTSSITQEKAQQIALKESKSGTVICFEQDTYFGKAVYEVKILDGQTEYECNIYAQTGEILKVETKTVYSDYDDQQLVNANPKIALKIDANTGAVVEQETDSTNE